MRYVTFAFFLPLRDKDPLFHLATSVRPFESTSFTTTVLSSEGTVKIEKQEENTEIKGQSYSVSSSSVCENDAKVRTEEGLTDLSSKICPGWFGKGYRKIKKRRQSK